MVAWVAVTVEDHDSGYVVGVWDSAEAATGALLLLRKTAKVEPHAEGQGFSMWCKRGGGFYVDVTPHEVQSQPQPKDA